MTLAELQKADIARILTDAGNTATIDGQTYNCIVSTAMLKKPLDDGGFIIDPGIEIVALVDDFGTLPAIGTKATTGGQEYRIVERMVSFTGAQVTFRCEAVNK